MSEELEKQIHIPTTELKVGGYTIHPSLKEIANAEFTSQDFEIYIPKSKTPAKLVILIDDKNSTSINEKNPHVNSKILDYLNENTEVILIRNSKKNHMSRIIKKAQKKSSELTVLPDFQETLLISSFLP